MNLDLSLLFKLRPEAAGRIYKTIGRQFEAVVIDPQNMFKHMQGALAPRGIEAEQVLLRNVQLPPLLTAAIQEKLQAEQQAQRMRFVLDRERQEADHKRVEAQGSADFQTIVAKGISAELLKWKAIEVAHELSKSSNAKVIVLGDKSGLPIILGDK